MGEIQRKVVNGVNTVLMHGKNYIEVCERVRLVHDQKREFEVIESSPFVIAERCIWRVVVKVDEKLYTGNAEVKLNARSGPDATNPFECGETSALGRALAFAGFGSVESIASFDEVYRATNNTTEPSNDTTPQQPTNSTTKPTTARPTSQATTNAPTATKTSTPNETQQNGNIKPVEGQSEAFTQNSQPVLFDVKKALDKLYNSAMEKGIITDLVGWQIIKADAYGKMVPDDQITDEAQYETLKREVVKQARAKKTENKSVA